MSPGRIVLSTSSPDRPRPAVLPCASTRPARGMSGFWIRQVVLHRISIVRASEGSFRTLVLDASEGLGAKGMVVSWANRPVGTPSCPATIRPIATFDTIFIPKNVNGGVYDFRCRTTKMGVLRFSGSEDRKWRGLLRSSGSEERKPPRGSSSKMGGSTMFQRTKNPLHFRFWMPEERKIHLLRTFSTGRMENPPTFFFRPPLDQTSPGPPSSPEVWIFSPIVHFEELSGDRDQPSIVPGPAPYMYTFGVFLGKLSVDPKLHQK